jgi:hypothetical protein
MSKVIKYALIFLSAVVLIVSGTWYYKERGFEQGIAVLTSIIALIGLPFVKTNDKTKPSKVKMVQKGGRKSKQYQAGGDMHVN